VATVRLWRLAAFSGVLDAERRELHAGPRRWAARSPKLVACARPWIAHVGIAHAHTGVAHAHASTRGHDASAHGHDIRTRGFVAAKRVARAGPRGRGRASLTEAAASILLQEEALSHGRAQNKLDPSDPHRRERSLARKILRECLKTRSPIMRFLRSEASLPDPRHRILGPRSPPRKEHRAGRLTITSDTFGVVEIPVLERALPPLGIGAPDPVGGSPCVASLLHRQGGNSAVTVRGASRISLKLKGRLDGDTFPPGSLSRSRLPQSLRWVRMAPSRRWSDSKRMSGRTLRGRASPTRAANENAHVRGKDPQSGESFSRVVGTFVRIFLGSTRARESLPRAWSSSPASRVTPARDRLERPRTRRKRPRTVPAKLLMRVWNHR
jgi:hypothetical protein